MKRVIAIIGLLILAFLWMKAQHYQTVYPDRVAYFADQSNYIKCIRIDSVLIQSDLIFYPFANIQQLDYECYTPYGPSWIGEKIMVNDSFSLFFNLKNDTIKIKTNAALNESWVAYELPDSTTITATVIDFDTMSFLEQLDSVKTIGFQVYDEFMTPVDHNLNHMTIIISRHHGIIKTFNFYLFPDYSTEYFLTETFQVYELIGLSKPEIGIQNLTWFDIFDFQPGDELHILYHSNCWEPEYGSYSTTHKTVTKYISRIDYPDSILYVTLTESSVLNDFNDEKSFSYRIDTIRSVIKSNTNFDKLPGEPVIDSYQAYANSMVYNDPLIKSEPPYEEWISGEGYLCWHMPVADGCFFSKNYYKGLGGPYYSCTSYFTCIGETNNDLVYYKKGSKTWGTPLNMSDIPDASYNPKIEFYPNPADEKVTIMINSHSLPATFELIDLDGKKIMQRVLNAEISAVTLYEIPEGIYVFKMIDNRGIVSYGKLVVE